MYLSGISPYATASGQLVCGNNNYPSSVTGTGTEYIDIRQLVVADGSMFTEADIKTSAKVCVIGKTIVDNLFPDGSDPIGKVIRFNQVPLKVIGVLEEKGYNSMGMDQDDIVLAPYTHSHEKDACSDALQRHLRISYLGGHDRICHRRNQDHTQEGAQAQGR